MTSTFHLHRVMKFAIVWLLSAISMVTGQTPREQHPETWPDESWLAEVPCRESSERQGPGFIGDREFRLCFKVTENLLQPALSGATNASDLYITSYTKKGTNNLTRIELVRGSPEEHPGLVIGAPTLYRRATGTLASLTEFKVPIQVNNEARSGRYPIGVTIVSGTDKGEDPVQFNLPILAPASSSVSVDKKHNASIDCWAGSECSALQLEVRNRFPYKLTISNISISSEDLLEDKPIGDYAREIEVNSAPVDLNVVMKAKPITFRRIFSGFGRPQVSIRTDYKDEYGRVVSTQNTADLQVRPNILIIAVFLILGAVIGTFIRLDLRRLQRANVITRRERAVFTVTTFASGIVICLIALFADIKIIAWSDSYSAWDPKVLFLTALVATVTGLPILYAYLKLPRPAEPEIPKTGQGGPTNPNPGS